VIEKMPHAVRLAERTKSPPNRWKPAREVFAFQFSIRRFRFKECRMPVLILDVLGDFCNQDSKGSPVQTGTLEEAEVPGALLKTIESKLALALLRTEPPGAMRSDKARAQKINGGGDRRLFFSPGGSSLQ